MADKFWANSALEPKRKHRWLLYLGGTDIPVFVVKTVKKPGFTINPAEHQFFGHKFYYPGNVTWDPVEVTLVDPIDPNVSKKLFEALRRSGYETPDVTEGGAAFTTSKLKATKVLNGQVKLEQLGPENDVVETFKLWNPWITAVKFGDLDYTSDEMVDITMTIQYDYATV